ncbi:MAG: hypothetical protein WBD09_08400 [Halobacteriota archaeon]
MEKIPAWIERMLLPKLNEITGEIKAIHTRIDSVEKEIVSFRNETKTEIGSLRTETKTEIASLRTEMMVKFEAADVKAESLRNEMISRFEAVDARFDTFETRIPVMEKMAEFEVRLAEIEKKLASA